jgi:signal transduction histidine kinase
VLSPLHFRLVALGALVVGATALVGWSAHTTWRRFGELHDGLQLAQRFEENVVALHTQLNQLALGDDATNLAQLIANSRELAVWIDSEKRDVHTTRQHRMLERITESYSVYLASVEGLAASLPPIGVDRLAITIALEEQLAGILRESVAGFLDEVREGLVLRQTLTFGLLGMLLALLVWLAFAVYQGMIAPLRVRLIEADSAIEQSQKLAALGVLAAGIAHEIRNPLTAIKARLFTHRKTLAKESPAFENTEFIGREIDRLERIVREFLLFARPAEPRFESISSVELLSEVRDLLAAELARSSIELRLDPHPDLRVHADRQHLQQVLINLVRNAAESIGTNGRVILRTRRTRASLRGTLRNVAILEVEDNGRGIPPEAQAKLFDPFFTTKPNGTGLGLSTAARIAEKHGGALRYQTQVNRGTTFGIVLPLPPRAPQARQ